MSDEILERATRALRERHDAASSAEGGLGLLRLERALTPSIRRRRGRTFWLFAAASLSGVTAWAGLSGRLPTWFRAFSRGDIESKPAVLEGAAPRTVAPPSTRSADEETIPPLVPPVVELVEPAPSIAPALSSSPGRRPVPTKSRLGTVAPPAASAAPDPAPDLDALYRAAHEAHFVRNDPAAALTAWDRYLAAAGSSGRMALEARYNRAIALVRLGRRDEAREALEPFARGEYGGYRREDAARLLESLR